VLSLGFLVTPGNCDAASLVAMLLGATATALLLVRLPGPVLLTFIPAVLLPSWLLCGGLATADIALVASLATAAWRTRNTELMLLNGGVTIAGVVLGALLGGAVSIALAGLPELPARELVAGAGFLAGYWLGETAFVEVVKRQRLRGAAQLPRSNPWANFLLLFPGYVLANLLLARGPVYFVPMLLVLVLALGLIALYLTATTAREAMLSERAHALASAAASGDVPPEMLEERAMELTHELRSPLTSILGYAGLLAKQRRGADPGLEEGYVESIASSSSYMLRLVNNILDLQRLESGSQPIQLRPVHLDRLLAESLAGIQPTADEKGVKTMLAVKPELPPLLTDELLVRRAVDNLLSNAVKYTRPGDEIRLAADREGAGIAISVADTGIGLTREERDRLFERFFRGRRSEARIERGTGLGLAIVREAMAQLDGEVRVESTLGEGSTFTLWLPLPQ